MKTIEKLPFKSEFGEGRAFVVDAEGQDLAVVRRLSGEYSAQREAELAAYIAHAANAYPKLIEALRGMVEARDKVRVSVQHFHKNRSEVQKDSDAASVARALLRSLGEQS